MDDVPEDKDERKKLGISDKDYEAWQESGPLRDYIAENPTLQSGVRVPRTSDRPRRKNSAARTSTSWRCS